MRRGWRVLAGGAAFLVLLAVLLAFALSAPARLLPYLLDAQPLQLSGVSGTVQNGRASRARLQTPGGYLHLGELSWLLAPRSLLGFAPLLKLHSVWGDQRGSLELRLRKDALALSSVDVNVDAGLLKQVLPVALKGRLGMLFNELLLSPTGVLRADGRLVWQGAAWESPKGLRILGNYAATFTTPNDQQINVQIVTLSGPVVAAGTVSLNQQRYSVDLLIESSVQELDPELAQALSLIASPAENGYRLRLDGEVSPGL
ncbi:MAG: type II secretion system protein N [Congregibacter sp.]|nr:type II secretion system protein N [Congregibacter sp.]